MRFFSKLNIALNQLTSDKFFVSRDLFYNNNIVKYMYLFDDYNEYHSYLSNQKDKCFYELINGIQRIYFDIDIDNKNDYKDNFDDDISSFINHIKSIYKDASINVYTSHRINKLSYHIVITNIYVYDNIQCRARVDEIIKDFDKPIKKYFDTNIYRRYQQLRLLGCNKLGINNTKISWIGSNKFEDSLVCHKLNNLIILPYLYIKYPYISVSKMAYDFISKYGHKKYDKSNHNTILNDNNKSNDILNNNDKSNHNTILNDNDILNDMLDNNKLNDNNKSNDTLNDNNNNILNDNNILNNNDNNILDNNNHNTLNNNNELDDDNILDDK